MALPKSFMSNFTGVTAGSQKNCESQFYRWIYFQDPGLLDNFNSKSEANQ